MIKTEQNYDRITFSLPKPINMALGRLKTESKQSKSEIIKIAIERYLSQQEKYKLKKAVQMMSHEYENNTELTEFGILDGEDFL
ncbi:MAG: ribbon-helix-helix protein, CopG family [Candidatus Thioglobus sp.]|uniref:ribbon-helix-helix protein, CopG family n=1 Tax=Candidatus Thioglobus sp. TaxID=2026721 RepID=UPI002603D1C6|nr:ribbon-helix-helix protein, CopG family [Candidatus Thioglobus sp.]MDC9727607.1 ribbon-helix-helix protein, CopG family [Candidatus Thioglobus sp.]